MDNIQQVSTGVKSTSYVSKYDDDDDDDDYYYYYHNANNRLLTIIACQWHNYISGIYLNMFHRQWVKSSSYTTTFIFFPSFSYHSNVQYVT